MTDSPMAPHTLASVAKRLEAATEGSRELDAAVGSALGWEQDPYAINRGTHTLADGSRCNAPYLEWTTSLDAANTLVPDGCDRCYSKGHGERAFVALAPTMRAAEVNGEAETLALAICAAALRLRARALPPPEPPSSGGGKP